jgi:PAS domain S-box-containing protein
VPESLRAERREFSLPFHCLLPDLAQRESPPPSPGVGWKSLAGLGAAVLVLSAVALLTIRETERLSITARSVSHTHEVLAAIAELESLSHMLESNSRNYVLTGDPDYLTAFMGTLENVPAMISRLESLVKDNPSQGARARVCEERLERRLETARGVVELRRTVGFEAALERVLAGAGKAEMAALGESVREMQREERKLLENRLDDSQRTARQTEAAVVIGYAISFALLVGTLVLLNRENAARLEAEQERRRSDAKFHALFEFSPDGLLVVDAQGAIRGANLQAEPLFGYSRQELTGKPLRELVSKGSAEIVEEYAERLKDQPRQEVGGKTCEVRLRRRDGKEQPAELSMGELSSELSGYVLVVARDITERNEAAERLAAQRDQLRLQREQALDLADAAEYARAQAESTANELVALTSELERRNKDLEVFAYVASHDLQEPLRAVAGCVQILQRRYASRLDERADELIGHAVEGAQRMQTLIHDLLAYSRVGTRGGDFASAEIQEVVELAKANLRIAIEENGATVFYTALPVVVCDPVQMTQLFQNLIGNALKYRGEAAPVIEIGAQEQGSGWEFSVRDNGIGIDPQYFERIFVMFQRLHTRADFPGTGIGLAIVRKIVERHGGRIWVESTPGVGSTFRFTIARLAPSRTTS